MAYEFSFAELVQARQSRRKRGVVQTSTILSTEVMSSRPRDPPSAGPSVTSTMPVMSSVRIEVREPIIPPHAIPVPESSSDEEPIALRRRGKRPITVDPEEVPLRTWPRTSEPSMSKEQTMILPPSFLGTTVPIVPSPRQPGDDEESILFNRSFALS